MTMVRNIGLFRYQFVKSYCIADNDTDLGVLNRSRVSRHGIADTIAGIGLHQLTRGRYRVDIVPFEKKGGGFDTSRRCPHPAARTNND